MRRFNAGEYCNVYCSEGYYNISGLARYIWRHNNTDTVSPVPVDENLNFQCNLCSTCSTGFYERDPCSTSTDTNCALCDYELETLNADNTARRFCIDNTADNTYVNACDTGYYLDTNSWRNPSSYENKIHNVSNWGGSSIYADEWYDLNEDTRTTHTCVFIYTT